MDIAALSTASAPRTTQALSQLTDNLDTFLTLLTTQLKNQDPLNPLDTEKFTSQLVQFASVEQSIETNKHLETLIGLQAATDRAGALAMIGRTVMIEGDKAAHDGAGATWSYDLPQGAAAVRLTLVDESGQPVAQFAGDARPGAHAFAWDGRRADGAAAPAGIYRLVVSAIDAGGASVPFTVQSAARVDGVAFAADGLKLETTAGVAPFSAVRRVLNGS